VWLAGRGGRGVRRPPCQGVSGYNMHRAQDPLQCSNNVQLEVYMAMVRLLRPKLVLMENVLDYLHYKEGTLAKLAMAVPRGLGVPGAPGDRVRGLLWRTPVPLPRLLPRGLARPGAGKTKKTGLVTLYSATLTSGKRDLSKAVTSPHLTLSPLTLSPSLTLSPLHLFPSVLL